MAAEYTLVENLTHEAAPPAEGFSRRTIFQDDKTRVVAFGFSPGAGLSGHTAPRPVTLQFLAGEATVTLGEQTRDAGAGTWIHIPANLRHSILARSPVVMLLTML